MTGQDEIFHCCIKELLVSSEVQQMKNFKQHGKISCLEHSLAVAYFSFKLCKRMRIRVDTTSLIRGALLHDLFLYDWHEKNACEGLHAFTHPKTAYNNAAQLFDINEKEKDIIVKHMWPLTIIPPKYRETLVVCLVDKLCSAAETLRIYKEGLVIQS